jgi:hypothetical protein
VKIIIDSLGKSDPKTDPVLVPGLSAEVRVITGTR